MIFDAWEIREKGRGGGEKIGGEKGMSIPSFMEGGRDGWARGGGKREKPAPLALLQRWDLPVFMCKFCPFTPTLSLNVSIFTLVVISMDR